MMIILQSFTIIGSDSEGSRPTTRAKKGQKVSHGDDKFSRPGNEIISFFSEDTTNNAWFIDLQIRGFAVF